MENQYTIRTVDELGRIILPQEVRGELKIDAGSKLAISVDAQGRIIMEYPEGK